MKIYSLNKITKIEKIGEVVTVFYEDGTKFVSTGDMTFEKDLINKNDQPIIDHCI